MVVAVHRGEQWGIRERTHLTHATYITPHEGVFCGVNQCECLVGMMKL